MFEIIQSDEFKRWKAGLKDKPAVLRINARIGRMADGNMGDVKPARSGISELRIDHGPGYPVLFHQARTAVDFVVGRWRQAHTGCGH